MSTLLSNTIKIHAVRQGLKPLTGVKNIIAVASGKGGVGKSSVSVNLALALASLGASVGILDADIYGPSIPHMLGATSKPESKDQKYLLPVTQHGVQSISIGYLIEHEDTPMIWRGPMVTRALQQLAQDTLWDDVDYLLIDLPPGTGDIQLTLAQKIPVTAALIVTTPQDIALLDARKALQMFNKVSIPVLGVIENMSTYTCPHCQQQDLIFGEGGAKTMASQYGLDLLGALPLDRRIREALDQGVPSIVAEPKGDIAAAYLSIAQTVAAKIALLPQDFSHKFPTIKVEHGEPHVD